MPKKVPKKRPRTTLVTWAGVIDVPMSTPRADVAQIQDAVGTALGAIAAALGAATSTEGVREATDGATTFRVALVEALTLPSTWDKLVDAAVQMRNGPRVPPQPPGARRKN